MARTKNTVTQAMVDELIENSDIAITTAFDKCTIVACQLPNGFVVVESSSCVDPANYDEDMGIDICMKNIERKVWELEGYKLQDKLGNLADASDDAKTADEPECDGDCEHCDLYDSQDEDDVKDEPKRKNHDDEDDDYWDKLIQTYSDYLDYVDDYLDDLARHSHKRRYREFNPYRNDYYNKVYC